MTNTKNWDADFATSLRKVKNDNLTSLSEEEQNIILNALMLAHSRYSTHFNGNIHYDFSFKTIEEQNAYADKFHEVEKKLRVNF